MKITLTEGNGVEHDIVAADLIRAHDAAVLRDAAAAIRESFADPYRARPLRHDAEFASDFANDAEWAAMIVEDLIECEGER